jgi:hypothetical protein
VKKKSENALIVKAEEKQGSEKTKTALGRWDLAHALDKGEVERFNSFRVLPKLMLS